MNLYKMQKQGKDENTQEEDISAYYKAMAENKDQTIL